jgi:hypothetical protein
MRIIEERPVTLLLPRTLEPTLIFCPVFDFIGAPGEA